MDQPILEKEEAALEEETPVRVEVVVHASGREYSIQLGYCSGDQLNGIHNLIRASFDTLAPTRGLTFVDQSGVTRHFNTNHIVCVDIRIR